MDFVLGAGRGVVVGDEVDFVGVGDGGDVVNGAAGGGGEFFVRNVSGRSWLISLYCTTAWWWWLVNDPCAQSLNRGSVRYE